MPSSRAFVHESRRFLCSCIRLAAACAVCSALCWCIRLLLQLSLACACALICVLVSSPVASLRRKTVGRILPTGPVRSLSTCGSVSLNTPASERALVPPSSALSHVQAERDTRAHTHTQQRHSARVLFLGVWLWRAACALSCTSCASSLVAAVDTCGVSSLHSTTLARHTRVHCCIRVVSSARGRLLCCLVQCRFVLCSVAALCSAHRWHS